MLQLLYSKAIEYLSAVGDNSFEVFIDKMKDLLSREDVQALLQLGQDQKNAEKILNQKKQKTRQQLSNEKKEKKAEEQDLMDFNDDEDEEEGSAYDEFQFEGGLENINIV